MLTIIIPCYNSDLKLRKVIYNLRKKNINNHIYIIDDCSNSRARLIINSLNNTDKNISIFRNYKNLGQGGSIKLGISKSLKTNSKNICTIDDDGQHTTEDIQNVINKFKLSKKSTEVVMGVRIFSLSTTPIFSIIGNYFSKYLFFLITKKNLIDTQTGLRCYSTNLSKKILKIQNNGFDFHNLMNYFFIKEKIQIHQIKIKTVYFEKNKKTRFKGIKDSIRIIKSIIKKA